MFWYNTNYWHLGHQRKEEVLSAWVGSTELSMSSSSFRSSSNLSTLSHPAAVREVFISWWRCAKTCGTRKNCSMQYMFRHTVPLNMSQQLKKGREAALNWQMSLVHCLRWPGFVLGGRAGRSQDGYWQRCLCTAQCRAEPEHSGESVGNGPMGFC